MAIELSIKTQVLNLICVDCPNRVCKIEVYTVNGESELPQCPYNYMMPTWKGVEHE